MLSCVYCRPKSVAARAGIRDGDLVLAVNGKCSTTFSTEQGSDVAAAHCIGLALTLRITPRAEWIREMHDFGPTA